MWGARLFVFLALLQYVIANMEQTVSYPTPDEFDQLGSVEIATTPADGDTEFSLTMSLVEIENGVESEYEAFYGASLSGQNPAFLSGIWADPARPSSAYYYQSNMSFAMSNNTLYWTGAVGATLPRTADVELRIVVTSSATLCSITSTEYNAANFSNFPAGDPTMINFVLLNASVGAFLKLVGPCFVHAVLWHR